MLTKSDFTRYFQCLKYMWLYKHRKDLLPEEIDEQLQRRFEEGYEVEKYAYELFPGGVSAQGKENDIKGAIEKTKDLIAKGAKVIFQPTFSDYKSGLFCRADIIKRVGAGEYEIYEVKGSTKVNDIHIPDIAFQKVCLEDAGLKIKRVYLILVNNKYIRHGNIEPKKLLKIEDVTDKAEEFIRMSGNEIKEALKAMELKSEPKVRILKQCWKPYECPFIPYCWKNIPSPSIYDANRTEKKLNDLLDDGIIKLKDVPEEMITASKMKFYKSVLSGKPYLDKKGIADFLKKLKYPLYFLDYETYSSAIPAYDGYKPYQQIPFQYSLHVIKSPGAKVEHFEHLEMENVDPIPALAKALSGQIGARGNILVWNDTFEKGRNKEMGKRLPKFAKFFDSVNFRVLDLMLLVKKGLYVHPDFAGSASIKAVMPVMAPELSYDGLCDDNGCACDDWPKLISGKLTPKEKDAMAKRMLAYCCMDSFGMVRILEEFEKMI